MAPIAPPSVGQTDFRLEVDLFALLRYTEVLHKLIFCETLESEIARTGQFNRNSHTNKDCWMLRQLIIACFTTSEKGFNYFSMHSVALGEHHEVCSG